MPFILKDKQIKTKLLGVAWKMEDIGRQQLLQILRDDPKNIKNVYVFGTTCYMSYDGKEYVLGRIKEIYSSLLNTHELELVHLQVTGGYDIDKGNEVSETAVLGCNIIIQLKKPGTKAEPVAQEGKTMTINGEAPVTGQQLVKSTRKSFAI